MTYDEWERQSAPDASSYAPPPPRPAPHPTPGVNVPPPAMGGLRLGGYGDWPKPNVSLSQIMLPPGLRRFMGPRHTTNPSFQPMRGERVNPSFQPLTGERPALQMPGVSQIAPPVMRTLASQPMAQYGPYAPMQNVTNAMVLSEASKDERARERMRSGLEEYRLNAMEPLMMRKYAEKMGYMPEPGRWAQIWRKIKENYTRTEGGLTRGMGTPAPR